MRRSLTSVMQFLAINLPKSLDIVRKSITLMLQ